MAFYLRDAYSQVELPNHEMGDSHTWDKNQTTGATLSGKVYAEDVGYPIESWRFTFAEITHSQKQSLLAFFQDRAAGVTNTFDFGRQPLDSDLKDWPLTKWIEGCRFASSSITFVENIDGYYTVTLDIVKVSTYGNAEIRIMGEYQRA